jgi:hypothetical protein
MSRSFEKISSARMHSQSASSIACPSVLLVGRSGSWGSVVLRSLQKFECGVSYESPQRVTPEFARSGGYDLILLDSTVPQEQRRELAAALSGSGASIFYTFPVESGCWWLPALRRGEDCHGTPAFRRNEFTPELERILGSLTAS